MPLLSRVVQLVEEDEVEAPFFDRCLTAVVPFFGMNAGKMMSRQRMVFFSGFHWFHCCCSLILRQVWVETTSCCHSRI